MRYNRIEILVEEKSMKRFLEGLLPYILPTEYILNSNVFIRAHEGKSDLQKKLPGKVRAFRQFPETVKVVVIQDQDSSDCRDLKQKLVETARNANADIPLLVRIACRELENWYLGDLSAVEKVYPRSKASKFSNKKKYRNPDNLNGAQEMERFTPLFSKVDCARKIAPVMNISSNSSGSFNQFVNGLLSFLQ